MNPEMTALHGWLLRQALIAHATGKKFIQPDNWKALLKAVEYYERAKALIFVAEHIEAVHGKKADHV